VGERGFGCRPWVLVATVRIVENSDLSIPDVYSFGEKFLVSKGGNVPSVPELPHRLKWPMIARMDLLGFWTCVVESAPIRGTTHARSKSTASHFHESLF
jgi:hypothetical protein